MKNAQFSFDEVSAMLRRRKFPFLIPFIMITAACTVGAFLLPKRYESSTTILVQEDAVLNPLVTYTMAVAMASDSRLRDFNEIIYSTPIVESLMDSLGIRPAMNGEANEEQMVKAVSKNIKTDVKGSDSFTLSYYASSPAEAQKAVQVLAELYIQNRLRFENSKNDFAVQFFSQRLNNLRDKFEQSQEQLVGVMKQHESALPEEDRMVYAQIDNYNTQISGLQKDIDDYQQALGILQTSLSSKDGKLDIKSLYEVPLLGVPYSKELQKALTKYDDESQKYTPQYPSVQDAKADLLQLLARTRDVVKSDLVAKQNQIWQIEKQRDQAIGTVRNATVSQSQNQDVQSNFKIYEQLYNDMKIKLEQAQTNRDLGQNSAREFMVIDPPGLPTSPAKPNRPVMIAGGFSLGLLLGLLSAGLAEIIDSRVRTPMDIEAYNKPVIAYLPVAEVSQKRAR